MEWYAAAIDPTDSLHVLAANNWNGVILQSYDGGQNWCPMSHRPSDNMSWRIVTFAPSDPIIVYAGTSAFYSAGTFDDRMPAGGIYVSRDGGTTWIEANDALSQDANVTGLAIDPHNSQVVYAATGNYGTLKSTDGGGTWTTINQGLRGSPIALSVAVHPSEPDIVYVGLAFGGLYRSMDSGATWQLWSAGLNPEASVSDILFDPANPQVMYAADRLSGVYRSADGGATWVPINGGLRTRAVNALSISSDGKHLYAATEGEGVYRLDLSGQPPQLATSLSPPTATPTPRPATPVPVTPTAIAVAPSATPSPTEAGLTVVIPSPTGMDQVAGPSDDGGLCVGAALPLALVGLAWVRQRK
jgi:photosystem II stability/assembly factor-like uncharacterized protein